MFYGLNKFIKNILPKRLFYRALLIVAVPVILLQLIITIVFFDRTEFNLKGYEYFLEDNSCYISERFLPKLEHDIGTELFNYAIANSKKLVEFSQDDFQDTFNPFKGGHDEKKVY